MKFKSDIEIQAGVEAGGSTGSNGQVLSSTGSGVTWINTGTVDGSGTANRITKWLDANTITNSLFTDNGSTVGLSTNGGSNTFNLSHTSGSGIALNITKGGNGEALVLNKTSGSGNVLSVTGGSYFNGNVGIGTTNPSEKLEVAGNILVDNGDNGRILITNGAQSVASLGDLGSGTDGQLALYNSSGTITTVISGDSSSNSYINAGNVGIGTTSPTQAKLVVNTTSLVASAFGRDGTDGDVVQIYNGLAGTTKVIALGASGADGTIYSQYGDLLLQPTAGNVGIGTTSPIVKLDVVGTARFADVSPRIVLQETGTAKDFSLKINTDGRLSFLNDDLSSEVLTIKQDGNVGIGTTSPVTTLHVEGTNSSTYSTTDSNEFESSKDTSVIINNSTTGTYANLFMASQGPSGKATGRIFLINQSAGKSAFTFQLRDSSHTSETREKMRINGSGKVSIGNTNDAYELDVTGEGRFTGDVRGLSFITTSQRDQKEGITDITKTKAKTIPFKEFKYKSSIDGSARKRYGVIAEDIENDYPELVHTGADGVKGVNYIDLLVKRVAELEKELEDATGGFTGTQTIVTSSKGSTAVMTYVNGILKSIK